MTNYEDYIPQSKLAKYREENTPISCPILGHMDLIPVVDHDHKTGRVRGVVSSEGNALVGKIENFHKSRCANGTWNLPKVLRAIADYLEEDQGPLHPVGIRQLTKRFGRMAKSNQEAFLLKIGAVGDEVANCKNSVERTKLYRKYIVK